MRSNFDADEQLTFSFVAEDGKAAEEGRLFPNCKHGRLRCDLSVTECRECGIPYGMAGLYWPNESMPEFDQ